MDRDERLVFALMCAAAAFAVGVMAYAVLAHLTNP